MFYFYTVSGFRKLVFWLFVLLAIGLGFFAYFELKNTKKPKVEAISLMPDSCLVYLNTHDFFELNKKVNSQSLIVDRLQLFDQINQFCTQLGHFDSLLSSASEIKEELEGSLIHFALYRQSQWLIALNIKELGKQEAIKKRLAEIFGASAQDESVLTFKLNKKQDVFLVLEVGVILLSNNRSILQSALNPARTKFENSNSYKDLKTNLSEANFMGIYVNQNLYSKSDAQNYLDLTAVNTKGFLAGTIDLEPSEIKGNGYLIPDSSVLFSHFLSQKAQQTDEIFSALPLNTMFFESFGFSSYSEFVQTAAGDQGLKNKRYWSALNKAALYNVKKEFDENIADHLVVFETGANNRFICAHIKDSTKTAGTLLQISDTVLVFDSIPIYRIRSGEAAGDPQLFELLSKTPTHFAMILGQHLYFSENEQPLFVLRSALKRKLRITDNESFLQYKNQHFAQEYNFLAYTSPSHNKEISPQFFKFKTTADEPYANFKHFSYSLTNEGKRFKFRFHLLHQTENKQKNTLWTLKLDTTAMVPPSSFVNHITKENEIVIQDVENSLYLINAKGSMLWKKRISEAIISEIYMVDIFKNNKFQMLFNTRNYIHLIDRNGKYVEGYPVKLPSPACAPLSVFDYDHTKDYRIFISCKNRLIYNYSIFGVKQAGFAPLKTENEVLLPIQYVAISESQYLVAVDKDGKIYTFSRKGIGRIGLRNRTVANCTSFYIDASNSIGSSYLVYFDEKDGLINKISFDDRKEIVKVGSNLDSANVVYSKVDDNRSVDMIITKGPSVKAFDFSGSLLLENTGEVTLKQSILYKDESDALLFSYSVANSSIELFNLFDQTQKTISAGTMPLISNLFKDNKKYMIFGNGKYLTCVLIN